MNGVIVPGLKKMGGQWLVPITALANDLDDLVDIDSLARATPKPLPTRHNVISGTRWSTRLATAAFRTASKPSRLKLWSSGRRR